MIKVDNILAGIYRVWQISLRKTMGSSRGREVLTDGKQKYLEFSEVRQSLGTRTLYKDKFSYRLCRVHNL